MKELKVHICVYCSHIVPNPKKGKGCSWSRKYQPVTGWEAEYHSKGAKKGGYTVLRCPKFERG